MTGQQISSAIRISKKFHDKLTIIWGGVHPTICPESVLAVDYVDYIIRGDGEEAFLNLLRNLDKKQQIDVDYKVHCFDNLSESNINFSEEFIKPEYFVKRDGFNRAFPLETSRGCPHKCAFCHNTILGHTYRTVDTNFVIRSIDQLYNLYNIDGVIFQEDNFFLNAASAAEILKGLKKYELGWKANSRISYLKKLVFDKKFMNLIIDAHCHLLQFGVESGSDRVLQMINKGIKVQDIIDINRKLSEYNIAIRYNFIIGFPTESRMEIEDTLQLINRLLYENPNMESPFVNIYTPYPGTPLYDLAKQQGFIPPKDLEGWSQIVWNYPDSTLYRNEEYCKFLEIVSNSYLENSKYPR